MSDKIKNRIKYIITAIGGGALGAAATLFVHFDSKNATIEAIEKSTVGKLSSIYENVTEDMSYDNAFKTILNEYEQLKDDNNTLTNEIEELSHQLDEKNIELDNLNDQLKEVKQLLESYDNTNTDAPTISNPQSDDTNEQNNSNIENVDIKPEIAFSTFQTFSYKGSVRVEELVSDPRGNTYTNPYVFYGEYYVPNLGAPYYEKPYIEKYIGKDYEEFSAVIVPYKDFDKFNKNIESVINVYADDQLIYTTEKISRKTENVVINLSIKDVNYLKIELAPATDLENYKNQYSIIMYNATIK